MARRMPARRHFMRKGKRIRYVDGFTIRNSFPDHDVIESDATSGAVIDGRRVPHVPKGEIWIDRAFEAEDDLLLEVHRLELRLRRLPYPQVRKREIEEFCDPAYADAPFYIGAPRRIGGVTLRYVRGNVVRRRFDPGFVFGGHDLVYPAYVPEGEVWIDDAQDPRERRFTILHELHERELMRQGWSYADAHREATNVEFEERRKYRERRGLRDLRPYRQSEAFCGPASLKICCDLFGREYDEAYLAALCDASRALGTDHDKLVAAVTALGGQALAKSDGSLDEVAALTDAGIPVIVGWYSPSLPRKTTFDPAKDEVEDHFSVVRKVTDRHVHLVDPEVDGGRKRISRARFERLWWDTDGPDDERVERWFMAVRFDGLGSDE